MQKHSQGHQQRVAAFAERVWPFRRNRLGRPAEPSFATWGARTAPRACPLGSPGRSRRLQLHLSRIPGWHNSSASPSATEGQGRPVPRRARLPTAQSSPSRSRRRTSCFDVRNSPVRAGAGPGSRRTPRKRRATSPSGPSTSPSRNSNSGQSPAYDTLVAEQALGRSRDCSRRGADRL